EDVRARYAGKSGRDLSQIDFFIALGFWKLAVILEGVYARYASGQYGETDEGFQEFAKVVERLADAADEAVSRLPSRRAGLDPSAGRRLQPFRRYRLRKSESPHEGCADLRRSALDQARLLVHKGARVAVEGES